jgi:hypothetical protein
VQIKNHPEDEQTRRQGDARSIRLLVNEMVILQRVPERLSFCEPRQHPPPNCMLIVGV